MVGISKICLKNDEVFFYIFKRNMIKGMVKLVLNQVLRQIFVDFEGQNDFWTKFWNSSKSDTTSKIPQFIYLKTSGVMKWVQMQISTCIMIYDCNKV